MSLWNRWVEYSLVFVASVAWFAFFQTWGRFVDPDGFTHAKIAQLISERGFLHAFPWLDLTILDRYFVDQHLGLHLLEIPFIKLFGILPGAQLAAVIFAACCITGFYGCAHLLGARRPALWAFLVATASLAMVRLSLAKSSPLAILCFIFGVTAFLRKKKGHAFIAGLLFSLVHGGWLLLLFAQGIMTSVLLVWNLLVYVAKKRGAVLAFPIASWRQNLSVFLATISGCFLGVLLHPNAKNMLPFLWVQVVVIGVQTPYDRVHLGQEWQSISLDQFLAGIPLFILVIGGMLLVHLSRSPRPASIESGEGRAPLPDRIALIALTGVLALLTLKSKRYGEYFIPTLALLGATVEGSIWVGWREIVSFGKSLRWYWYPLTTMLVSVLVYASFSDLSTMRRTMMENNYPFTYVSIPMKTLSEVAAPGDRVFYPQWDLFPMLFVADDRLRYISGMDPTYLFVASTTRSDIYSRFTFDQSASLNVYGYIHDDLRSQYVFLERGRNPLLEDRLNRDMRFTTLFQNSQFHLYRVLEIGGTQKTADVRS